MKRILPAFSFKVQLSPSKPLFCILFFHITSLFTTSTDLISGLPLSLLHSSSNISIYLSMHSESLLTTSQSNLGCSSGGLIHNLIHPCLFQREPESITSVRSSSAFWLFGLFSLPILTRLHTHMFTTFLRYVDLSHLTTPFPHLPLEITFPSDYVFYSRHI